MERVSVKSGSGRAYLELLRFPNVFTAMADILCGYLVTQPVVTPWFLAPLLLASSGFYLAGMVLNDVYDLEQDRQERPQRPLPSRRISVQMARRLGFALLALGVVLSAVTAALAGYWEPAAVGIALAALVWGYDAGMKRTPLGPVFMGACRAANILLGMSLAIDWQPAYFAIAIGLGVYVAGITWFARKEAIESPRWLLVSGTLTIVLGLVILMTTPSLMGEGVEHASRYSLLMIVITVLIARRCVQAIVAPSPALVQAAVKQCLFSLVILDAAVVFLYRGPLLAVAVVSLLLPAMFLGRWIYST